MIKKISLITLLLISNSFSNDDFEEEFNSTQNIQEKENIILETYNRNMTKFNDNAFNYVLKPLSQGFEYIVPETGRIGINNFFNNILFPIKLTNSLLQFKFEKSLIETERFLINSTFGLLGFMDPATKELNIVVNSSEDFGQTLAYYGVPSGPHIVLPLLGPSNIRDSIGLIPDYYINPTNYIPNREYNLYKNSNHSYYYNGLEKVNKTSFNYKLYENINKESLDLYLFLKSAYNGNREKLIKE